MKTPDGYDGPKIHIELKEVKSDSDQLKPYVQGLVKKYVSGSKVGIY